MKHRFFILLEYTLIILHSLVIVLIIGQERLILPPILEVTGRMHPLLLHFPIVLLIMAVAMESLISDHIPRQIRSHFLLITVLLTGLTVAAGLILSFEPGYEYDNIKWHQWTAIALFWLGSIWYWTIDQKHLLLKKATPLLLVVLVIVTGHLGANITHGENFLLEPLKTKSVDNLSFEEALAFDHVIKPIFEQKCISCHKASKQKGELRLDEIRFIQAGGKSGKSISTENPEESLIYKRIHLSKEDEEHMPPKEKAQLTEEEKHLISAWIGESPEINQKITAYPEESQFAQLVKNKIEQAKATSYPFSSASAQTIKNLNNEYRLVKALTPQSPALEVRFFGRKEFQSTKLQELKKVQEQVVSLNLSYMDLREGDVKTLANFKNLESLHLNFTGIQGPWLKELKSLKNLKQLSLSGNPLQDEDLKILADFEKLEKLFLWQTEISEESLKAFQRSNQKTSVITGFQGDGTAIQLNPPILEYQNVIFKEEETIRMKHPISSVTIFYTLDGSEPDSLHSERYTDPIKIGKSSEIKARAFAKGWIGSSDISTHLFKARVKPENASLSFPPDPKYSGNGAATLFDLEKGDDDFASGKWLGFQSSPMEAILELDSSTEPRQITLSLFSDEGSHIFLPESIEVWQESQGGNWQRIHLDKPKLAEDYMGKRYHSKTIDLDTSVPVKNVKIRLNPLSTLPKWHNASGSKGWVFIDEILID
ncbi:c-type cytochrome domain-containing protein [Arthrospiribacter ruber]|uniref:Cytochrome C n=1 Tax=Arthrospiribacter ruber TaxID=2487934 RepID=A0A951IQ36_9BACT|nr:c-type cytochrome domain-containing protein [Arthrospiribacter ruber]MBW3466213.1 cytochrome C [Arthrospiribacter ruber]